MKIENISGMIWQLHKSKYIRFKNIHFSLKNSFQLHCQLQILWSDMKSFSLLPMRKKSGAHCELTTVTSWWAHCEFTVTKMQSCDLAVSSPWSECSPWQFVFSWDFHTDMVLHASSFAPVGTDFDHLVQKAICHKYKVTRIDHINWKCSDSLLNCCTICVKNEILIKKNELRNSNDCTMQNEKKIHKIYMLFTWCLKLIQGW